MAMPRKKPMDEEAVVLNVFSIELHANIAQDVLQDEGVKAFVYKDDPGAVESYPGLRAGVRLVVSRNDAERARYILRPLTSF